MNQPRSRKPNVNKSSHPVTTGTIASASAVEKYCKKCGRLITPRVHIEVLAYCSTACRKRKPTAFDRRVEEVFVERLGKGGGGGVFVLCSEVEEMVYSEGFLERVGGGGNGRDVDEGEDEPEDEKEDKGENISSVYESHGGRQGGSSGDWDIQQDCGVKLMNHQDEKNEDINTDKSIEVKVVKTSAEEGMDRAKRRERVKQAARRVVVFREGYICRSKNGKQLDVSHAHGDWGVARA